jgi:predicted DNA-binding protein
MNNDSTIIVRLDKRMKADLLKLAEKDQRTVSSFVRVLINKAISESNPK